MVRSERIPSYASLAPVWEFLAFSINAMFSGRFPKTNLAGELLEISGSQVPGDLMYAGWKLRLCELRGDWQHHFRTFNLASHYTSKNVCHMCSASRSDAALLYTDFSDQPAWMSTMRSQQEFLVQQCKEPINRLLYAAGFHYSMIRFCAMHTVHLGIGLFANGGAFFELLKVNYFPGRDQAERFRAAFAMFKN